MICTNSDQRPVLPPCRAAKEPHGTGRSLLPWNSRRSSTGDVAFDSPVGEQEVAVKNDLGKTDEALHASGIAEAGMSESKDR